MRFQYDYSSFFFRNQLRILINFVIFQLFILCLNNKALICKEKEQSSIIEKER